MALLFPEDAPMLAIDWRGIDHARWVDGPMQQHLGLLA
ncbi:hypothetical protein Mnod_3721 [Methylobacterium nodulans ORS 2060]|uniref:Uncharacterized protein n=1 Tax=Methylobacterium nodulans (strain LMG 21967 / CNCM I-2342 / ORS 2060) TaxID=460265 RepID=B8IR88_METNO|nr:hypothetical protein Mnod_3721 [Methylobacterium nodulans ORS 2060]